jgi:hypothetical protein
MSFGPYEASLRRKMLDSVLTTLQNEAANLSDSWAAINVTYRALACLLLGLFLIWEATRAAQDHDGKFFLLGMVALGLLAYSASLFAYTR